MILMLMVGGFTSPDMATFGSLTRKQRGRHIRQEDGYGSPITAGLGYRMSRGAGPHITMGVGFITAIIGAGGLDRCMSAIARCGLPPSFSLLASDTAPASVLAPSDGSPWARMIRFIPGMGADFTT